MESSEPGARSGRRLDKTGLRSRGTREQSTRKARGVACSNCRARKVRCEGSRPTCKTCEVYNDECRYDETPPMSQVTAMARRLEEAERTIAELRQSGAAPSGLSSADRQHRKDSEAMPPPPPRTGALGMPPGNDSVLPPSPVGFSTTGSSMHAPRHVFRSNRTAESGDAELSVDAHGKILYYGPTSAVHDPPAPEPTDTSDSNALSARAEVRSSLAAHAKEAATWEDFALRSASTSTGIPLQLMARLLHMHWTWISPMFMWVYRPAFIRDMTMGGPYYSELLLTIMCGHAAKYHDKHYAEPLITRAKSLLGAAIQQPSSIPTVQALLQLSARSIAHGTISQAWIYSGIAFRMASDLGLQHGGENIKGLKPVDLEIRRRLYWSCYFWDKATSLYTGRLPAVTEIDESTLDLLDDYSDSETWCPNYGSLSLTRPIHGQYPPMNGYSVSGFVNSCRLAIIINDIIVQLYSRRSRLITEEALGDIESRLLLWREQSPVHLKYEPDNLPSISPPPHIISQNILYFTTTILAHRPFWSSPTHYQTCIDAARSIEKLVLLLESTFGLENITYLMGYCIYTGASAVLEEAKSGQGMEHPTLKTFLRALNTGKGNCPCLERSLHIIIKGLGRPPQPSTVHEASGEIDMSAVNSYIPAFPYLDPNYPISLGMDSSLSVMDMDPMAVFNYSPDVHNWAG